MQIQQVESPTRNCLRHGARFQWSLMALGGYDDRLLDVEGQGWKDIKAPFDRLPAKAEGKVPDAVWNLSRQSAGLAVRFVTDSPTVHVKWSLTSANLAMPHMPATGVSGIDLY